MNEQKEFSKFIKDTFTWIDPEVKKYMYRAWCKRGVIERKKLSPPITPCETNK